MYLFFPIIIVAEAQKHFSLSRSLYNHDDLYKGSLKAILGDSRLAPFKGLEARHRVKAARKVPTALTADTRNDQDTS